MSGRRTWASDEEREAFQTDALEVLQVTASDHEDRIADLEAAPGGGPDPGLSGDISQVDSGDAAAAGASSRYADAAHQHAVPAPGAPSTSAVGDVAAAGAGTALARADHTHGREAFAAPGASAPGDTVAAGSASAVARSDHRHSREAFGSAGDITSVDAGDTAQAGSTGKVADAGHQHATTLTAGGGGSGIRTAHSILPAGVVLSGVGWADIDNTHDKVLTAAAGDVLVVSINSRMHNTTALECYIDAVTVVGGTPVTSLGGGGAAPSGSSGEGIPSLIVTSGVAMPMAGTVQVTLGAGDVSGGQVRVRLRQRTAAAANRTIQKPLHFSATVYTPA